MTGKILIADDMATNRIVLKAALASAFYEVIQATSGAEVIELATETNPDLIILSERLSDTSGIAAIKLLHRELKGHCAPVMLILAKTSEQTRLDALKAGACDVIERPVNDAIFGAKLRCRLRQAHAKRDLQLQNDKLSNLGFADAPFNFSRQGKIAVAGLNDPEFKKFRAKVCEYSDLRVTAYAPTHFHHENAQAANQDVLVYSLSADNGQGQFAPVGGSD